MTKMEERFNRDFSHFDIRIPPEAVKERGRGKIVKAGWAIWYRFGVDDKGEYLDYYAAHRMTTDRHTRVYEDGHVDQLPTIRSTHRITDDPDENARLKAKFYKENRAIEQMLAEKGFGVTGDEPGSIQINRYLCVRPVEETPAGEPGKGE